MKRLGIILMCVATLTMASCSFLQSGAGANAIAQTTGQTCGSALLGLYNSYKSTGTISLSDPANLGYALSLATAYTQIKQNKDDKAYRKSFGNGLVMAGAGLITKNNSNAIIDALLAANGLANVSSTSSTSQKTEAVGSIMPMMQLLN